MIADTSIPSGLDICHAIFVSSVAVFVGLKEEHLSNAFINLDAKRNVSQFSQPVEPNPPLPLAVFVRSSAHTGVGVIIFSIIN